MEIIAVSGVLIVLIVIVAAWDSAAAHSNASEGEQFSPVSVRLFEGVSPVFSACSLPVTLQSWLAYAYILLCNCHVH